MDWRSTYRIALSLIALFAFVGAAWLVVAPEPSPGVEIIRPTPAASAAVLPGEPTEAAPTSEATLSVNLNTASVQELMALSGIGETLAGRIVAYRETNGPFLRTDQIMAVSGIGPATYEKLRGSIRVRE